MKLKIGILILTIILFGKNIVNAFDYRYNGSCVYWNAGTTGEWMNQNNWTDSSPTPDYLVPGWYAGIPITRNGRLITALLMLSTVLLMLMQAHIRMQQLTDFILGV